MAAATATAAQQPTSYMGHMSNGDGLVAAKGYAPTHPGLFVVQFAPGSYNSCLVAQKRFPKDSLIATMSHASPSNVVRYSTVQVGENSHIELNSDLLYCNHSCDPSVRFDVSGPRDTWCARAEKDIEVGDVMTFFYPSTEWHMSQPFDCNCATSRCLGRVSGASHIPASTLRGYFLNGHIVRLKQEQIRSGSSSSSKAANGANGHATGHANGHANGNGVAQEESGEEAAKRFGEGREEVLNRK